MEVSDENQKKIFQQTPSERTILKKQSIAPLYVAPRVWSLSCATGRHVNKARPKKKSSSYLDRVQRLAHYNPAAPANDAAYKLSERVSY